jgi:hypothetical protein
MTERRLFRQTLLARLEDALRRRTDIYQREPLPF